MRSSFVPHRRASAPAETSRAGHTIVVAPTGAENADDGGPGTAARPLATLWEARRRAREAAAEGDRDVVVLLLDGIHRLLSPLRLDAADSGRGGHTVTWRAARGARPVLSGARPVTGWEPDDPDDTDTGVYRARVGTGFDTRQLYVDGVLARRARIRLAPGDITPTATGFTVDNPDLAYLATLPDQGRIELQAMLTFTNRFAPLRSVSGSTVVMQQPAWDNNTYGYDTVQAPFRTPTFFLLNSRSFLTEPGEWYLDPATGTLYYKPLPGQDVSRARVELPRLESLLQVGGTYDEPARNLRFEGLTFTGTTWLRPGSSDGYANQQTGVFISGVQPRRPADAFTSCSVGCTGLEASRNDWAQAPAAVQVSAADDIGFLDSTFVNLGSVGLGIGNDAGAHATGVGLGAHRVSVVGSTFTASAGGGIVVGGVRPDAHHPSDPRMVNSDIVLSDNRVHATALEYLDQAAILATYVTRLTIEHNHVSEMPYIGIGVGYGWGANDVGGSPDYVDRGLYRFQPVHDTPTTLSDVHIVGNHVRDVVRTMYAAGCIYALSAIPRGRVEENFCENSGQYGLYFDEGARYLSVRRNVFADTAEQWAHANNGVANHTGDLTLIGNYTTNPAVTGIADGDRGNVVRGNVVVTDGNLPIEASRVIYEAGPAGPYRGAPDPRRPPAGAFLSADPVTVGAGGPTIVTVTVENLGERPATGLAVSIAALRGWRAERAGEPVRDVLAPGDSATETWKVTAPESFASPADRAQIKASVMFRAGETEYVLNRSLTLTAPVPSRGDGTPA
ncbi:NEW3 domain-containing protein [Streptosporangium sp. NPDC000509]|uniref:NEW3 domain-containing protein n=1 Tax=Streptosporangium sp. NPDC000509 TaxID=3366186 RepID=UPI0036833EF8